MTETTNVHRLNQELEDLQHQYDLLSENIRSLAEDYHNTPMEHEKLQFQRKLEAEKTRRAQVEQELRAVSERLDALNQNKLVSEKVQQHLQYLEATVLIEELQDKVRSLEWQQRNLKAALTEKRSRIQELEAALTQKTQRLRELEGSTDFFEQHKEGDLLDGVIQRIHPQYGIFIEVAPNITGLARRETLDRNYKQLFKEGEKIKVEIKRLDRQARKVDLEIKSKRVGLGKSARR